MQRKFTSLLMLIAMSFTLASCGDLFMKKKSDSSFSNNFLSCSLDAKALSGIFTENIKGDLLCLKESLNLFVEVVKTDRPGFLSQVELKKYIRENVEELDETVLEALSGVFDINSLIFGDHPKYISKTNIGPLVELFIEINRSMVNNNVFDYYTDETQVSYKEHNRRRLLVYEALSAIGGKIISISKENNKSISFKQFLERFKGLDNNIVLQSTTKMLFIKKMFLGGEEGILTSKEFRRFAAMLSDVSKVSFDIAHLGNITPTKNESEQILQTARVNVATIVKNLYYKGQDYTDIMSFRNIYDMIDLFAPEYAKWKQYTSDYLIVKKDLLGNDTKNFNSNEIYILLNDIILENLNRGVFIYKTYALNKKLLDSGDPIGPEGLPKVDTSNNKEKKYKIEVNKIVQNYRFFKGDDLAATYKNSIARNPLGIFEVSVYQDLIERVLTRYGNADANALGGAKISQEKLLETALKYKGILIGEDILTEGREKNTVETIYLMSSLFQAQSDGDIDIEVNELVEFAVSVMSAGELAKATHTYFEDNCELDDKGRYTAKCYRENFMEALEVESEGVLVKEKLEKLHSYFSKEERDISEYLKVVGQFSRSCTQFKDGTPVPMTEAELMLAYSGMLAVEQTMIRYDVNEDSKLDNDNYLQIEEVEKSFGVYKNAVQGLSPIKSLSEKVFWYLIKNKKAPSPLTYIFVLPATKKSKLKAGADRQTLATILKTLSEESPANKENPFPCEILR
jgi:hypothetical protein